MDIDSSPRVARPSHESTFAGAAESTYQHVEWVSLHVLRHEPPGQSLIIWNGEKRGSTLTKGSRRETERSYISLTERQRRHQLRKKRSVDHPDHGASKRYFMYLYGVAIVSVESSCRNRIPEMIINADIVIHHTPTFLFLLKFDIFKNGNPILKSISAFTCVRPFYFAF